MKNRNFLIRLVTTVAAVAIFVGANYSSFSPPPQQVMGAGSNSYDARSTFQANHVRYDSRWPNSIQTNWEADAFPENISDMSYGRVILNAETAGTYTFQIWYAAGNAYPVKVFANGIEHNYEPVATGWANALGTIDEIELNEGRNVFIIAMLKWGVINGLVTPSAVTVVKDDTSDVYQAVNAQPLATYLKVVTKTIHDHDAVIYTQPLEYNSNPEFASKVKFTVAASETTKSVDLTYYCNNNTDGLATLNVAINGEDGFDVYFDVTANDVVEVKTLTTGVLTANGFVVNQPNIIEIIKPYSNNDIVGLVSLTLSDVETDLYTTTKIEAESAVLNGGKVEEGNSEKWSNASYVGDIGTKTTLTGPSQINEDLTNVNSLSFAYEALNSGIYYAYIRYGTEIDSVAYIRGDVGPWKTVTLLSTTWWDTCRVAVVELYLNEGERTITLTGTTNEGGWVNYDFIDIVQKGSITVSEIAYNFAIFFREKTSPGCTAQNVNMIPWAQLKSEYLAIPDDAKDVYVASVNEIITDARARYNVLITVYPTLAADNWLVDGEDVLVYEVVSPTFYQQPQEPNILMIIVLASLSVGLLVVYRLVSKRKFF